jgi:hypothetical protein
MLSFGPGSHIKGGTKPKHGQEYGTEEVTGDWSELHDELHELYSAPNIFG